MKRIALTVAICSSFITPVAIAQTPQFQHIVIIVQENRTPDNLFQGLCAPPYGSSRSCSTTPGPNQYNIQTNNWLDKGSNSGVTQPLPVVLYSSWGPEHYHMDFLAMCDFQPYPNCQMDGAAAVGCQIGGCPKSKLAFYYVDNSTPPGILNPYLEIATQYGWANHMFQTNQGPSFPAHQFLFAGTSAPSAWDDSNGIFAAEIPSSGFDPSGCLAPQEPPPSTTVQLIRPPRSGEGTGIEAPGDTTRPCFEHQTMGEFQQFSWKYYTPPSIANTIWTAPNAIQHICGPIEKGKCTGPEFTNNVDDNNPKDVLTDISSCQLRDVSWVIPTQANSDWAGAQAAGGPSWVASIVNAIGGSTGCDGGKGYWKNTAIFITWDDWGGWYDHVPPPMLRGMQGDYQYGFRVPLLVVSAYTPAGYIDNRQFDFGSILKFIEQNFGIPETALGFADARAKWDLTSFFDAADGPRTFKKINSPLDGNFFINDKTPPVAPDDD